MLIFNRYQECEKNMKIVKSCCTRNSSIVYGNFCVFHCCCCIYLWFKSSIFTIYSFCHYRQPSPQTSPNAMPHSTSTTTVAREQVFICQERINIPRKFISLNRQRAQRIFLLWLYANNECAFSLSRAPFLASTNALFPFHESHSQCLRFFREITEDDNEGWWVSWVGEDHYDVICLAKI